MTSTAEALAAPAPTVSWVRWVRLDTLGFTLVLGIVAFLVLYPTITLLTTSFQIGAYTPHETTGISNWIEVFSSSQLVDAITNTLTLSFVRQCIGLVGGVVFAWLIARTNLPMGSWIEVGFWIALFMPALPVTLSWVLLAGGNVGLLNVLAAKLGFAGDAPFNIYSYWGIVWVHIMTSTLAIKVFLLVPAFRAMDAALEDAARTCGAPVFKTLLHIVVPIMLPTIIVVVLLGTIRSMQAFEVELILGKPANIDVYSTIIFNTVSEEPPRYGIASVLSVVFLVTILPFVALQQWYSHSHSHASISSKFSNRVQDLGRLRWPLFAVMMVLLLFMTVLPFAMLMMGSFMKFFGMFDLPDPWTTRNWAAAFSRGDILRSFWNSIRLAASASIVGMVSFTLVAYIAVKTPFYGRKLLDFLTWLPAVIPGLVLSLGLLQMFVGTPIFRPVYGTMTVLVIALAIGTMTLGTQVIKTALMRLGPEMEEASLAAGASRFYTFRRVILPLIVPSVAVIGLEVFAVGVSVVGLVALLGTGETQPMSVIQLIFLENGMFEPAAVIGILIMTTTITAALLARTIGLKAGIGRAEA